MGRMFRAMADQTGHAEPLSSQTKTKSLFLKPRLKGFRGVISHVADSLFRPFRLTVALFLAIAQDAL
jgi:hypothetical protein